MADLVTSRRVSVVVPVYNDARAVRETVEHLLRQSLPAHEIVVVDDGSTDETPEVLKRFGDRIILLSKPNGGPASARNCGVAAASGDLVAFTDSDCLPQEDWLAELVKGFDGGGDEVGGVGGVIRRADPGLLSEYADVLGLLGPVIGGDGKPHIFATANVCFPRSVLLEANLFDEHFTKPGGEDVALCYKIRDLGYEFRLAEETLVLHHHRRNVRSYLRTMANYGEGQYGLDARWPERRHIGNARRELLRSPVAVRTMLRRCLAYRAEHGLKRAALFAFLDYYGQAAYAWGYLRGERKAAAAASTLKESEEGVPAGPCERAGLKLRL